MTTPQVSDRNNKPEEAESLEENGHSLLIVDLLELPRKFSFKRYRVDLIGFGIAWLIVAIILLLTIWMAQIGV